MIKRPTPSVCTTGIYVDDLSRRLGQTEVGAPGWAAARGVQSVLASALIAASRDDDLTELGREA